MGISEVSCHLQAEPAVTDCQLLDATQLAIDATLGRRLANAKARLDRLEQQPHSRDDTALASARVEFSLASRALADDLLAHGLIAQEHTG
ncbi:hypothetical protein SAMN05192555_10862 [Franzmannia pantelleriensis]|uniref:Uncharacterized protein n=1 Tax=Franzmannia pantelleriensis TaxID=48727 RepID=A0A1G9PCQ8_9GAMM|nr:hypothetical protein [Halomonas pantelleriensis]SDL96539.1 hypothetical protein SAMN05192555_10862 [Halomonas pantelleriensis]